MEKYFTEQEKEILLKIKSYYDKIGTVSGVAKELNLQSWRVRKFLRKGHWYGLFYFDKFNRKSKSTNKKRFVIPRYQRIVRHHKYNVDIKKLVRLFKKYGFLPYVSEVMGIPTGFLHQMLTSHYGVGLTELRKVLGIRTSCLKRRAIKKNLIRYQQVKEMYDRLGTLAKVGKELNISRERVRQILARGTNYGFFSYEPIKGKENIKKLIQELTREDLIKDIQLLNSKTTLCLKFNINERYLEKLLEYFNIDLKDYQKAARMGRYIQKYSKIVDDLGYHPTTTEMNSRRGWRGIWSGISRYWGNFDNFRKEFGIDKPKMRIHPNTLVSWRKMIEKKKLIKKEKKEKVLNLIREQGPISLKFVCEKLDFSYMAILNYANELLGEKLIDRAGSGNQVKYIVNQI